MCIESLQWYAQYFLVFSDDGWYDMFCWGNLVTIMNIDVGIWVWVYMWIVEFCLVFSRLIENSVKILSLFLCSKCAVNCQMHVLDKLKFLEQTVLNLQNTNKFLWLSNFYRFYWTWFLLQHKLSKFVCLWWNLLYSLCSEWLFEF